MIEEKVKNIVHELLEFYSPDDMIRYVQASCFPDNASMMGALRQYTMSHYKTYGMFPTIDQAIDGVTDRNIDG